VVECKTFRVQVWRVAVVVAVAVPPSHWGKQFATRKKINVIFRVKL